MSNLRNHEFEGTLSVFGITVLRHLYAKTDEDRFTWEARIPRYLRWLVSIEWNCTWTYPETEYRDATGKLCRKHEGYVRMLDDFDRQHCLGKYSDL